MESGPGILPGLNQESDIFLSVRFDSSGWGPYYARAMGNPLQERRTPQELAASGQVIEITNKIGDFEKLAGIVESDLSALDPDKLPPGWRDTVVAGQLGFGFVGAQASVEGQVAVTIDAVCQRCLQLCAVPLQAELRLVFEEECDGFDVWELDEKDVCPADLIEEALIMTIPFAAMHDDDANCVQVSVAEDRAEKMTLPFADLKAQMDREN
ncbi:MAG: YceD family protein [Woeseiaceae bacterium]